MKKILYGGMIVLLFLGCNAKKEYILFQNDINATKKPAKKTNKIRYIYQYKIVPSDRLSITVFNHPELSTSATNIKGIPVYPDGTVSLPLIGEVKVAGLTEREASQKIQKLYAQYIKKPYVKLEVLTKKVYVLGEVRQPGIVQLSGDYTTLIEAISQKGGLNDTAMRKNILIISGGFDSPTIRQVDLTKISSLNYKNLLLKPNDIVYIQPMGTKPLDVKIQGVQPILGFINSVLSTFVNIKIIAE